MATQTVPHVVSFPQSVPAVEVKEIAQQELIHYIDACNTLDALQKHADALESSILARLRAGATVESGVHVAEVKRNTRRNPAWKDAARALAKTLGFDVDEYCSNVLAQTPPSISYSLNVR